MDSFGYEWEAYESETEDGWYITMFRITGVVGDDSIKPVEERMPLLIQHGLNMDAESWYGLPVFADLPGRIF